jgi:hypothetical protein
LQQCPYCDDRVLPHVMAKHILRRHPEKLRPPEDTANEKTDASVLRPGPPCKAKKEEEAAAIPDDRRPTEPAANEKPEAYSSFAQVSTASADTDPSKQRKRQTPPTQHFKSKILNDGKKRRRRRPRKGSSKTRSADSPVSPSAKESTAHGMIKCRSCGAMIHNTREARARHVREEHNHSSRSEPTSVIVNSPAAAKPLGVKRRRSWVRILPGGLPSLGRKR